MSSPSFKSLLSTRRFLPFFITQFLGAFNDNLFKQALVLAVLFRLTVTLDSNFLVNLCALLFILPFFLFSALGGQLGEKYDKDWLIRRLKLAEIFIMGFGAFALWLGSLPLLLAVLFAMGMQSALFGPVKYAILPQALREDELIGGNGLIEMGTFLAILLGTLAAGVLMNQSGYIVLVGSAVCLVAVFGYLSSRQIPLAKAAYPTLSIDWNVPRQTWAVMKLGLFQSPVVSRSILGNSWFWFLGAIYLAQIPTLAKENLGGDETVVSLILAVFSVGIALGSWLCERLSDDQVEIGLVPFGSFGLTVFGALLGWHCWGLALAAGHNWLSILQEARALWVLFDLLGIGVFAGLYIVPLYALIQSRTADDQRARVIAANNILNALFMVVSALVAMWVLSVLEWSIAGLFLLVITLNVAVGVYIFSVVPEFTARFMIWLLTHTLYRVKHQGLHHIPQKGAAVLVCNHISFVDALLIAGSVRRPLRFVMYYKIYNLPVLNFVFRAVGAIPIAGRYEDAKVFETAFQRVSEYLRAGELVCIFPEGKLTADGEIDDFKAGVERILREDPVPVIPMALQGLWGSFFSRSPERGLFKRVWSRVALVVGEPMAADTERMQMQAAVQTLRGEHR